MLEQLAQLLDRNHRLAEEYCSKNNDYPSSKIQNHRDIWSICSAELIVKPYHFSLGFVISLVRSPSADDFLTGFGSTFSVLASLGEAVFALSNSPLIGRPRTRGLQVQVMN